MEQTSPAQWVSPQHSVSPEQPAAPQPTQPAGSQPAPGGQPATIAQYRLALLRAIQLAWHEVATAGVEPPSLEVEAQARIVIRLSFENYRLESSSLWHADARSSLAQHALLASETAARRFSPPAQDPFARFNLDVEFLPRR